MTRRELFEKAHALVKARQQKAVFEMEERREKVLQVIPDIVLLERTMQQAAVRISTAILHQKATVEDTIPKIMEENLKAQHRMEVLLLQHGFSADALDVQYSCPHCHDTGYVKGDHCSCVRELIKRLATEDFNESAAMKLETFESFDLKYYRQNPQEAQTMQQILEFCKDYAETFTTQAKNVIMSGKTGLGKTHLSLAIAGEVLGKGYQVLYGSAQDFFGRIQNEYFNRAKADTDTMAMIMETDLLILDDLGAEFESSFNTATLYNIINGRMNIGKPTMISTNLTAQELQARYNDRIASRLTTVYSGLRFVGVDVRQQRYLATKKAPI